MRWRRNRLRVPLHFVWATRERRPLITEDIERAVYRYIEAMCLEMNCEVKAIGGTPNHVHLLVTFANTVSFAEFMKRIKGGSSRFITEKLRPGEWFQWQENYAVYAVSWSHRARVIAYIENQKQHHANGTLWEEAEETDEEYDADEPRPSE
jgi:putative transposase